MALFDARECPIYLALIFPFHPFLGLLALGGAAVLSNNALTSEKLNQASIASTKGYQNAEAAFSQCRGDRRDGHGLCLRAPVEWKRQQIIGLGGHYIGS